MKPPDAQTGKKNYHSPQFYAYGDIKTITQTNDNSGQADGPPGGNMDKT